jgi:NTP pyrophosphatase (non-canonical NTP hydrolase)
MSPYEWGIAQERRLAVMRDFSKSFQRVAADVYALQQERFPAPFHFGEKIALVHSELSEALEAYRRDKMDDHLPHRSGVEVELADAVLRIMGIATHLGLDLAGAIVEKHHYNQTRPDHLPEARAQTGGKRF